MSATFTVDSSRWRKVAIRYVDDLGLEAPDVVRDQTRLLARDLMKITPPPGLGLKSRKQGEEAVERDIARAMTPVTVDDFDNRSIKQLIRNNDRVGFEAFLRHGMPNWRVEQFDTRLHTSQRNRRGTVRKQQNVFVLEAKQWQAYLKEVQSHVGRMKAAWGRAVRALGGRVPRWIARHIGTVTPNSIYAPLLTKETPSITIGNLREGIGRIRPRVEFALRTREKAMIRDIKRRIKFLSRKHGVAA